MLCFVNEMKKLDAKFLMEDMVKLENGTLQVDSICCVIAPYCKSAATVASLAENIKDNLYKYNEEMFNMGRYYDLFGKELLINEDLVKLLNSMEDDIRELQNIVSNEENDVVELITKEMKITVADAMVLNGLRKMINVTTDMVGALVCIMQVTNKYVDIFYDSEKMKEVTGCGEIKCRGLHK